MDGSYKFVDPKPRALSESAKARLASCLYRGNYGAVYPEEDGSLTYEFIAGELGDRLRHHAISAEELKQLISGQLTEITLIQRLGY